MVDSFTILYQSRLVPDSLRDILSQSQHKAPVCSSVIPSAIQKFIREHSTYKMFGTRSMYRCIAPMTLLTMQRLVGDLVIPTDDETLVLFIKTHFLPLPTYDKVNDHFKNKIYMKAIRSNIWDANTPAALCTYFDNFHNEVNIYDIYFSSLSVDQALKM